MAKVLLAVLALSATMIASATWTEQLSAQGGIVQVGQVPQGKVWWKLPSAFQCQETANTIVPKWGSCAAAVAQGGCESTEFSIQEICCKSCCKKDASDAMMAKSFGPGATCKSAAERGYCTQNHDIKRMCCKTCPDHVAKAVAADKAKKAKFDPRKVSTGGMMSPADRIKAAMGMLKKHGKNKDLTKKGHFAKSTEGTVWWKLPSAFKCQETVNTQVPKWGSCPDAAAQGGCTSTEFSIQEICCRTCCVKDASDAMMARAFGPGASCAESVKKGYCTKNHDIKRMCCKSCQEHIQDEFAGEKKQVKPAVCKDATASEMEGMLQSPGVSCSGAAKHGACKYEKIRQVCCETCSLAESFSIQAHELKTKAKQSQCTDVTNQEMEKIMGKKGVSCLQASRNRACRHKEILDMCCASCKKCESDPKCN